MSDTKQISRTLRKVEYGVYVVSVGKGNTGNAFTASWLTQVSSEPVMIALAVHKKHQSARLIVEHGAFVVNLLYQAAEGVAKIYFGPAESGYEKLKTASLKDAPVTGTAMLTGTLGFLDCRVVNASDAGNHKLFVAEVMAAGLAGDGAILTSSASKLRYAG